MTPETVQYSLQGQIATIRIDDGKRNALSPQVLRELYRAFDRANLVPRAEACAEAFQGLVPRAHTSSKRRIRKALVRKLRFSIPLDLLDAAMAGMRNTRPQ
jgi:hypothetical protein